MESRFLLKSNRICEINRSFRYNDVLYLICTDRIFALANNRGFGSAQPPMMRVVMVELENVIIHEFDPFAVIMGCF